MFLWSWWRSLAKWTSACFSNKCSLDDGNSIYWWRGRCLTSHLCGGLMNSFLESLKEILAVHLKAARLTLIILSPLYLADHLPSVTSHPNLSWFLPGCCEAFRRGIWGSLVLSERISYGLSIYNITLFYSKCLFIKKFMNMPQTIQDRHFYVA